MGKSRCIFYNLELVTEPLSAVFKNHATSIKLATSVMVRPSDLCPKSVICLRDQPPGALADET